MLAEKDKLEIYKLLIDKLPLLQSDRDSLKKKRGFSDEVINALKFRSCSSELVNKLNLDLPAKIEKALSYPNILIPYFDKNLDIVHIRPHKYGIEDEGVKPYFPFPLFKGQSPNDLVIAESEFKAVASIIMGIPAIGIPGIASFSRNHSEELRNFVSELNPRNVVICFDREIKDNPEFPNYKKDYTKRYDTQFYAYVMAVVLQATIAVIPDDWMHQGKADIDHCLSIGMTPSKWKFIIDSSITPITYKQTWKKMPPAHLSFLERKIDKFYYTGPIFEQDMNYYYMEGKKNHKLTNFVLKIVHTMYGENEGTERFAKFYSNYGVSKTVKISPDIMASKASFIKFCYENGDYEYHGKDDHLTKIWSFLFLNQSGRIINKISAYGWNHEYQTWFFENGGYSLDKYYPADEDGIIWIDDVGYKVVNNMTDELDMPNLSTIEPEFSINEMYENFYMKVGERDAKMIIGWSLGTFFLPEIMKYYGLYPFIFLHGKMGSGKSTISNWISSFFGFEQKGFPFSSSTAAGIKRITAQMSMVPVWFEEYRAREQGIVAKNNFLRSVYDRSTVIQGTKKDDEIKTYTARSTIILSGEETPNDAALNSRCLQISMVTNKDNGTQPYYLWLEKNKQQFSYFGHWILTNKSTLWPKIKQRIDDYIESFGDSDMKGKISNRITLQTSIIGSIADILLGQTESFSFSMGDFAKITEKKRANEQALYVFYEDIVNLHMAGKLKFKWFHVEDNAEKPGGVVREFWMWFGGIYNEWELTFKNLRQDIPASKQALTEHIKSESYFIRNIIKRVEKHTKLMICLDSGHPEFPDKLRELMEYEIFQPELDFKTKQYKEA